MEGPTPVSALIHAATMVTAGVYMVARSHVLFELSPFSSEVVAVIGGATALFAATMALVQMDLKRVLAYSTISQLGYMFVGVGVMAYGAGVFHLMTHAFFKALLFLGAGSVMHAMSGVIDMRYMGNLREKMPWTYRTFFVAALAIAGFPFLSGFFSKDEILAATFESGNYVLWGMGLFTAGLTAFYMFRALFMTFHGTARWDKVPAELVEHHSAHDDHHGTRNTQHVSLHPHESPSSMTIPLMILAVLAAIAGYVGIPKIFGPNFLEEFFAPVFHEAAGHMEPMTEIMLMGASVAVGLIGIAVAYWFYIASPEIPVKLAKQFNPIYQLLWHKYYVDEIYSFFTVKLGHRVATFFWQSVDVGIIDAIANGLGHATARLSHVLRGWQTGYARAYALLMLVGTVLVIGWLMLSR